MKKEDIYLGDWSRMFLGEAPPEFYIEIVIRMIFVYFLLVLTMRILGKRMAAQLSRNELLALVTLAAAIGVPVLSPERGLIPALIIALVIVVVAKTVARLALKNQKFEHLSQDNICTLVEDSVMQLGNMKETRITPERLYAQLRSEGVMHLGEVKRLYLEANGSFSIIKKEEPQPGLSVLPPKDTQFCNEQREQDVKVCFDCGKIEEKEQKENKACPNCGSHKWVPAVL